MLLGWGAGSLIGGFADADRVDRSESAIGELGRRLPAGTAILADDVAPLGGQVLRLEAARVLTELGAARVLHEERRQECKQKLGGPRRVPAREVPSQEVRAATY